MNLLKTISYTSSASLRIAQRRFFSRSCASCNKRPFDERANAEEHKDTKTYNIKDAIKEAHATNAANVEPLFPSDLQDHHADELEYNKWHQSQERHSFRPKIDPSKTSILLFPGQGSQFVGMGTDLLKYPNVSKMYKIASDILGYDLLDVTTKGPASKLNRTVYCQPAILVASLAAVEKLRDENPHVGIFPLQLERNTANVLCMRNTVNRSTICRNYGVTISSAYVYLFILFLSNRL